MPSIPHFGLGVAQLVARYLGVVEAVGSSPVTQTKKTRKQATFQIDSGLFFFTTTLATTFVPNKIPLLDSLAEVFYLFWKLAPAGMFLPGLCTMSYYYYTLS